MSDAQQHLHHPAIPVAAELNLSTASKCVIAAVAAIIACFVLALLAGWPQRATAMILDQQGAESPAAEKIGEPQDVAAAGTADDHRSAHARLEQADAAQDERAHHSLAELGFRDQQGPQPDRKSTRLNSSHRSLSRMPSSA